MSHALWNDVLAAPLLAGDGLRLLLVIVVAVGVVLAFVLVRAARKPSAKQEPPITRARLVRRDDD